MQRMYDVSGKLLNGIKSMYVNSLAYTKSKRERESDIFFRMDKGVGG